MEISFKNKATSWFNSKKKLIKGSSVSAYYTVIYRGLIPFFENKEINNKTVQEYVLLKTEENKSKRTIQDHIKILCYILRGQDVSDKNQNHTFDIEFPTILDMRKREAKTFNISELKKLRKYLVDNAENNIYCFGILISLSLGLRIGEVTGLMFSDFDFKSKMVSISRTAQRITVFDDNNSVVRTKIVVGPPKTRSSNRKLPVQQVILDILKKYMFRETSNEFIFKGKYSSMPLDNRLLRTNYYAILNQLNLPKITFHGLRHSFASNCIASKIDVKTTSSMLGHSDIKMTLEIYTHPSFEQKKQAINKLSKLFSM